MNPDEWRSCLQWWYLVPLLHPFCFHHPFRHQFITPLFLFHEFKCVRCFLSMDWKIYGFFFQSWFFPSTVSTRVTKLWFDEKKSMDWCAERALNQKEKEKGKQSNHCFLFWQQSSREERGSGFRELRLCSAYYTYRWPVHSIYYLYCRLK